MDRLEWSGSLSARELGVALHRLVLLPAPLLLGQDPLHALDRRTSCLDGSRPSVVAAAIENCNQECIVIRNIAGYTATVEL